MAFHFFTEPLKIQNQTSNQAFGAIDINQYRLGNMFSAVSGQTPKAFAVTDGQVLVQKIGTTSKYSIILKPTTQPDLNLPKIDYIIYKGIKEDSLISGALVAPAVKNDLTRIIHENATAWYAAKNPKETVPATEEPDGNRSLGLVYNATAVEPDYLKLDSAPLSDAFFATNGITLTSVFGGNHIGDFDTSGNFGIVIVFEKIGFQPTFKLARELDSLLTYTPLGASPSNADTFQRKHEKEDVLAFMDSSAFFGAFLTSELMVYNGTAFASTTELPLYNEVIDKHINKNKIYLDIINEYGDSFNYYENYNNSIRWSLNNTEALVDIDYYRNFGWPILVITDTEFNVAAGSVKVIRLSLPNRDNEFPLIYLKRAYREDIGLDNLPVDNEKFLTPIADGQDANLVNQVRLNRNLIIPQINNLVFSNFFQIKYLKRAKVDDDDLINDQTNNFYGKALFKRTYLDNVFPIFDMQVPFLGATTTNLKVYNDITHTDKILIKNPQINIVGDYTLRDYTSSIGIAKDQSYTTFMSFPFLYNDNINHNNDLLPLSTMEFGENPYLIELNNLISSVNLVQSSFTNNGQDITFLKFENNDTTAGSTFTPTNYSFNDILIISITNQQYDDLLTLKDANFPGGYKVYLGIKDITPILSDGNNYYSFHLVLRGLRVVGNNVERHFLDTNIISYTNEDVLGISSGHVFPVGNAYIEEDYGERNGGHLGIDIETITDAATPGSPIYAAHSGTVEKIVKVANLSHHGGSDSDKAGVRIRIQGDNGYYYYYFHMQPGSNDAFSVGDAITAGQQIGTIGLSGQGYGVNPNWTQYHLHFEIWSSVSPIRKVNPYTVFPELALLPFDTHRRR